MVKQLVITSLIIYLLFTLLFYIFQRQLIYHPPSQIPKQEEYHAEDLQSVSLHTQDGLTLNAWYKPAEKQQATVLYLHGNASHIGYPMFLVRQFLNAGLGILLVEYRGYGGNKGHPSEQGLYADGRAGLNFLQQKGVKANRLAIYGESLGTGVATQLAIESPLCALVLQSPFTSLPAVARYHYPWLFISPWDKFNSLERIKSIHTNLLIIHGKRDELIPYAQGLTLFQQAEEPKKMLSIAKANHNDLWNYKEVIEGSLQWIQAKCSD